MEGEEIAKSEDGALLLKPGVMLSDLLEETAALSMGRNGGWCPYRGRIFHGPVLGYAQGCNDKCKALGFIQLSELTPSC